MKEISSRILFPSAVFRFTDNCVLVQLIQTDEAGNSGVIAENSFPKIREATEYYIDVCKKRQEKMKPKKEEPKEEPDEQNQLEEPEETNDDVDFS
jgi:hypothetical protein